MTAHSIASSVRVAKRLRPLTVRAMGFRFYLLFIVVPIIAKPVQT